MIDGRDAFSCGETRLDLRVPVTRTRPLETGLWTGSPDEYLKLARGDVLFRRTERRHRLSARVYARVYFTPICSDVAGTNLGIPA